MNKCLAKFCIRFCASSDSSMSARALVSVLISLAVSGCGERIPPLKWTEDVKLPDGRVTTLTRYQEFRGTHELGAPPTESNSWFEFKNPETSATVRWQGTRELSTVALMMDGPTPLLLTMPNFSGPEKFGCPNPPYLLFRFSGTTWQQVIPFAAPISILRVNMTFHPHDQRLNIVAAGYHLSAQQTSSYSYDRMPFLINLEGMTKQTFSQQNCGQIADMLIVPGNSK